jgi:hypothetical protein
MEASQFHDDDENDNVEFWGYSYLRLHEEDLIEEDKQDDVARF